MTDNDRIQTVMLCRDPLRAHVNGEEYWLVNSVENLASFLLQRKEEEHTVITDAMDCFILESRGSDVIDCEANLWPMLESIMTLAQIQTVQLKDPVAATNPELNAAYGQLEQKM